MAVLFAAVVLQAVSMIGWSIAFPHMSNAAILASLSICPLGGIVFLSAASWSSGSGKTCSSRGASPWHTPRCFCDPGTSRPELPLPGTGVSRSCLAPLPLGGLDASLAEMGSEDLSEEVVS